MSSNHESKTEMYQDGRQGYVLAPRQTPTPRRAYRVKEVSEMLGLPKSTVYDLIRRSDLRAVLLGSGLRKIVLIPAEEIDRLLSRPPRGGPSTSLHSR